MGNYIPKYKEAVVVFNQLINNGISGVVLFIQKEDRVIIKIDISGNIKDGLHGFHIHESGDLREGCNSCCSHYNPHSKNHGGLNDGHVGDLGNIIIKNGICNDTIETNKFIIDEIIGRSLIIHENEDDLGKTNHKDSKTTGNSGKRIACSIIGISKNYCK
jgi:Cu-Zn family superoxide dismutase